MRLCEQNFLFILGDKRVELRLANFKIFLIAFFGQFKKNVIFSPKNFSVIIVSRNAFHFFLFQICKGHIYMYFIKEKIKL